MPSYKLHYEQSERKDWEKAAEAKRVHLSVWIRLALNEAAYAFAQQVKAAAPKPYVKPGPKGMTDDEYLDKWAELDGVALPRFASGQRRFRKVVRDYAELADDERAHALCQEDLLAQKGVKWVSTHPKLYAYMMSKSP